MTTRATLKLYPANIYLFKFNNRNTRKRLILNFNHKSGYYKSF